MFVYELYNVDNELLYVGVTNSIPKRFGEHKRLSPWWSEVFSPLTVTYECSTRGEALLKEYEAIDSKSPKYSNGFYCTNLSLVISRDDKLSGRKIQHILDISDCQEIKFS